MVILFIEDLTTEDMWKRVEISYIMVMSSLCTI
jgi:hypothetical protein